MSTVSVYLVRHGEAAASWGQSADPGLSELGRQQALEASLDLQARLQNEACRIISSPLLRARETARPFSEAMGVELEVDDRFREIPSTVPLAERQQWLRGFMQSRWSEQQEGLQQGWREQMLTGLHELTGTTVVFSHFLVINTILGAIQERDETLLCWPDNGSITVLSRETDNWSIDLGRQMKSRVN